MDSTRFTKKKKTMDSTSVLLSLNHFNRNKTLQEEEEEEESSTIARNKKRAAE